MNLTHLSDDILLREMETMVNTERGALTNALHHLLEIDRRKLFSALGYSSLYKYALEKLKYSGDEAHRRISVVRLMRELPSVAAKLENGTLNLTNLSLAQSLFRRTSLSTQQKAALVKKLENKSTREAQKIVLAIAPKEHDLLDRVRAMTPEVLEFQFPSDEALLDKIRKLKSLLAHSHPHISLGELFHMLCDLGLQEWQPHGAPKKRSAKERAVWERDHGRCTNCGSEHALEIDHIIPKAKGGSSEIENLRLLCRSCNQRAAIAQFGQTKMDSYLKRRKPG